MRRLLDTRILLRTAAGSDRLPSEAHRLIEDRANTLVFGAASLWEIAIRSGLGRNDFQVDPRILRRGLLERGHVELAVTGAHAAAVDGLPATHRDPLDRLLIAQANSEGLPLVTADRILAGCGRPVRLVRAAAGAAWT